MDQEKKSPKMSRRNFLLKAGGATAAAFFGGTAAQIATHSDSEHQLYERLRPAPVAGEVDQADILLELAEEYPNDNVSKIIRSYHSKVDALKANATDLSHYDMDLLKSDVQDEFPGTNVYPVIDAYLTKVTRQEMDNGLDLAQESEEYDATRTRYTHQFTASTAVGGALGFLGTAAYLENKAKTHAEKARDEKGDQPTLTQR